jgi:hypothetical protein
MRILKWQSYQKMGLDSPVATKCKHLRAIPWWMALVFPVSAEDWPQ